MTFVLPRTWRSRGHVLESRLARLEDDLGHVRLVAESADRRNIEMSELIRELRSVVIQLDASKSEVLSRRFDDQWKLIHENFAGVVTHLDHVHERLAIVQASIADLRELVVQLDSNKSDLISKHFSGLIDGVAMSISSVLEQEFEQVKAEIADARQSIIGKMS